MNLKSAKANSITYDAIGFVSFSR